MVRTVLMAFVGMLVGVGGAVALLVLTQAVLRWMTDPRLFAIEHGVVYLGVILGAGFGALCGTVVGLAGVLAQRGSPSSAGGAAQSRPLSR